VGQGLQRLPAQRLAAEPAQENPVAGLRLVLGQHRSEARMSAGAAWLRGKPRRLSYAQNPQARLQLSTTRQTTIMLASLFTHSPRQRLPPP
jgi:hypothetical protein